MEGHLDFDRLGQLAKTHGEAYRQNGDLEKARSDLHASFARWLLEEVSGLPSSAQNVWREGVTMLRYDAAIFSD